MLDYLPIFPELMEALEEFDDAAVGRIMKAMAAYAFTGEEPEFPKGSPERFAWAFIKQRVDAMIAKRARAVAAGEKGGRPRKSQPEESTEPDEKAEENQEKLTKANKSRGKQPKAEESPQSQTQSQSQAQPQEGDTDTHTETATGYDAGARARPAVIFPAGAEPVIVPAGWYDPEHPDAPADNAWMTSEPARQAIAQRIIDHVMEADIVEPSIVTTDEGIPIGRECFAALCAAMRGGAPPALCQRLADGAVTLWGWEIRLKETALERGTAPREWRREVDELSEELEQLVLYG